MSGAKGNMTTMSDVTVDCGRPQKVAEKRLAEGVGFEPTDTCASPVFKTGAFDHSATLPLGSCR